MLQIATGVVFFLLSLDMRAPSSQCRHQDSTLNLANELGDTRHWLFPLGKISGICFQEMLQQLLKNRYIHTNMHLHRTRKR